MKPVFALLLVVLSVGSLQARTSSHNRNTQELVDDAMRLSDGLWDAKTHFLHHPYDQGEGRTGDFMVRESAWYAVGLLDRDGSGDRARAAAILDAVLSQQFNAPGEPWDGTFRRSPENPDPKYGAITWRDYDPNWREFIGTTFALILLEHADRVDAPLRERMYRSIDRCIESELAEHRLLPTYSNIAVMHGFLWSFAAAHDTRTGAHPDWQAQSLEWARTVYKLYRRHDAFNEYNSPTYYGVDLYGLALWRRYGPTREMRRMGAAIEASLWTDIASLYEPSLRNLSGPYDRSYGMDMESYVTVLGVWMRTLLPAAQAPLPALTPTTDHVADAVFAPLIAALGACVPPPALEAMRKPRPARLVRKRIADDRAVTAWLSPRLILGGESGRAPRALTLKDAQYHPLTMQWRTPSGSIGWVRIAEAASPSVEAGANGLRLQASPRVPVRFEIHAAGLAADNLDNGQWSLPGLNVGFKSDVSDCRSEQTSQDTVDVLCDGLSHAMLRVNP